MRIERLGVGTVALHAPPDRSFTAAEEALLHDAADRAALAIRQALLFEAEHRTAVELQRGLLPKHLPQIEGLRLAAHYEAAGAAAEVGGDWYDAFALSGARVGIVVGDVAGRGIPAASTMGQLRSVTRALAIQDRQQRLPGEVLTRLNRYQLAIDEAQFVTVLYAIIDPQDATVVFASAGHLPPLLRSASGDCRYLRGGGYPLGTEDVEYDDTTEHLHPGDALILYTDGLVERRGEAIDAGLERLAQAVREGPREPQELCEHLLEDALPPPEELFDDVTALVAEIGPAPEVSPSD
jgi:serine phosphatase RsbU (regulator of sigma subunit)